MIAGAIYAFRADADEVVGMGHLARCLSLAEEARARSARAIFLLGRSGAGASEMVRRAGWEIYTDSATLPEKTRALFADLAHPVMRSRPQEFVRELARFRAATPTVVIDGHGAQALAGTPGFSADLVVSPYVGDRSPDPARLAGPGFFILHPGYRPLVPRAIPKIANRLLISFGGADPVGTTAKALRALRGSSGQLAIRVVIGPCFKAELIAEIESLAAASPHAISIDRAPSTLAAAAADADLALIGGGLTKYELAAVGLPALVVAHDRETAALSDEFCRAGSARLLGSDDTVGEALIARSIRELANDRAARLAMSEAGQALVDGRGAARIFDRLEDLIHARQ